MGYLSNKYDVCVCGAQWVESIYIYGLRLERKIKTGQTDLLLRSVAAAVCIAPRVVRCTAKAGAL